MATLIDERPVEELDNNEEVVDQVTEELNYRKLLKNRKKS